jgi:hypothetical protein
MVRGKSGVTDNNRQRVAGWDRTAAIMHALLNEE